MVAVDLSEFLLSARKIARSFASSCTKPCIEASTCVLAAMAMEEWDFVDDRDLQGWKGGVVCMTCQHFAYGVDRHCHTLLACNLRRRQLAQGDHLKKRCKLWVPTSQSAIGWTPEAG